MANNTQLSAAVGVGDVILDIDLITAFSSYPLTGGKLPVSALYCSVDTSTAPTPVTNANPLPTSVQNTVTVSGTVTAVGGSGALALDSSVNGLLVAQGSTTSGEHGPLIQAAVTTAAPAYTTGQTSPLSLDTAGNLRVNVVSGGSAAVGATGSAVPASADYAGLNVAGTLRGRTGVNPTGTVYAAQTDLSSVGGTSVALGQAAMAASIPVVLASNQSAVNVSSTGGALALDASVTGLQVAQGSATTGQHGNLVQGAVTTAAPTYTTAQTSPLSLTTAGALRVDASSTTQPVSGTVTANIGTTNGLALDTSVSGILLAQGSTTSGEKGPLVQGAVTTGSPTYTTGQTSPLSLDTTGALRVNVTAGSSGNAAASATGSAVPASADYQGINVAGTLRGRTGVNVTGVVYAAQTDLTSVGGTAVALGQAAMAASIPVVLASNQSAVNVSSSGGALALDASVTGLQVAQGSTTSGQHGNLIRGAVTTGSPTYTTGQTSPLSLDTTGALRVNVTAGSSGNAAASATGSAVPASADYQGLNVSGNLRGQTGVNPTGSVYAAQVDLASVGGTSVSLGSKTSANSIPVVVASDQGSIAVAASQSGAPWSVTGSKTNNNAAPGATNVGVLPAVANAAVQSWTEGNLVALSTDLNGQVRVFEQDLTATGVPGAANATVTLAVSGDTTVSVAISGIGTMTLAFEASIDGSIWFAVWARVIGTAGYVQTTTTNNNYVIEAAGYNSVRVRCSAYTSGTANITMRSSSGDRVWPPATQSKAISFNSASAQTIVAGSAGKIITVTSWGLWTSATSSFSAQWQSSTGSVNLGTCWSNGTTGGAIGGGTFHPTGHFQTAVGDDLKLLTSAGVQIDGYLTYTIG